MTAEQIAYFADNEIPEDKALKIGTIKNLEAGDKRRKDASLTELCLIARGMGIPLSALLVDYANPYKLSKIEPFSTLGWTNIQVHQFIDGPVEDVHGNEAAKRMNDGLRIMRDGFQNLQELESQSYALHQEYELWRQRCEEDVFRRYLLFSEQHRQDDTQGEESEDKKQQEITARLRLSVDLFYAERVTALRHRQKEVLCILKAQARLMGNPESTISRKTYGDMASVFQWAKKYGLLRGRKELALQVESLANNVLNGDVRIYGTFMHIFDIICDLSKQHPCRDDERMQVTLYLLARCLCYESEEFYVPSDSMKKLNACFSSIISRFDL
ncbi:hypothetical protein [Bifidobacterium primatium]|uniref:hypothetical protein n=1 Tax=Bifidobacterium primatium TaxID=2045438 RepID=UPI001055DF97|nr:hypothetical protein [Bifidobacterium primatium]